MAESRHHASRPSSDFEASWETLLASGRQIVALSECNHGYRARRLRAARDNFSQHHFERYPVGPALKQWYEKRLAELFALEAAIEHSLTQDRQHRHLQLVK